ncbi:hypothetical protein BLNAU_12254 [Blattamonas nauphoetae]|uniref:Uncharacterized protein n=1 Tax=Blattamonas nauphoetae TaxID=2049346 RepID=A0ABQ9XL81_9EUKA|nr:hypothetical protein BLNAU_12254 [Blattamonas nauphoetae]
MTRLSTASSNPSSDDDSHNSDSNSDSLRCISSFSSPSCSFSLFSWIFRSGSSSSCISNISSCRSSSDDSQNDGSSSIAAYRFTHFTTGRLSLSCFAISSSTTIPCIFPHSLILANASRIRENFDCDWIRTCARCTTNDGLDDTTLRPCSDPLASKGARTSG